MCAVDDCEPWEFATLTRPVARKEHRCCECRRVIRVGERYHRNEGKCDGEFSIYKWCWHCGALSEAMNVLCGGWPLGGLYSELTEHWYDGYRSIPFARLIAAMKHQWHDGRDPVPTGVPELAKELMTEAVSA